MATHGCINCPRCKQGCSICRRCACRPEVLAHEESMVYKMPSFSIGSDDPVEEQKPETD